MKNLIISALALGLLTSTAVAQEIITDNINPLYPTISSNPYTQNRDTYSWKGAYIGVNGGFLSGRFHNEISSENFNERFGNDLSDTVNRKGFVGGAQVGYNFQHERNVYGFEFDAQLGAIKGDKVVFEDIASSLQQKNKVDWYTSARVRLGYAISPAAIIYTTGGLAYGKVSSDLREVGTIKEEVSAWKKNQFGYTIGAGTEIAMTDHLTFKTEYLYTDLGNSKTYEFANTSYGTNLKADTRFDFHTVRAGFNFKF